MISRFQKWCYALIVVLIMATGVCLSASVVFASHSGQSSSASPTSSDAQVAPSGDGCWTVTNTPYYGAIEDVLYSVAAISPSDVWAVGTYYDEDMLETLTLHWNGSQWRKVPSVNRPSQENQLLGVEAVAPNDVWAVGYSQQAQGGAYSTLALHWNGTQWSIIPTPNGPGGNSLLRDIAVISSNDIWAVGDTGSSSLAMHWDGSQWSVVSTPAVSGTSGLQAVTAVAPDDVWAVGVRHDSSFQTLTMHWNGTEWSVVPSPSPGPQYSGLIGVSAISSNDVWAVGSYTEASEERRSLTLTMHWNGTEWSVVPSPNYYAGNALYDVVAIASNDVWAVGRYLQSAFQTVTMHWNGAEWSLVRGPHVSGGNILHGVDAATSNNVWSVGYTYRGITDHALVAWYESPCPVPTSTPEPTPTRVATATPLPCTGGRFNDVPPSNPFYPQIACLVSRGVASGYSDCTFRPDNLVTRGQLAKLVSNAAGFAEDPNPQIFEDVPASQPFYEWINRLAGRGVMGGYQCGGPGEPCIPPANRAYFRAYNNVTRGQSAKIVANTFYSQCQAAAYP